MDNKALADFVKLEVSKVISAIDKLSLKITQIRKHDETGVAPKQATDKTYDTAKVAVPIVSPAPTNSAKTGDGTENRGPRRTLRRKIWRQAKRIFFKKDRLERIGLIAGITYAAVTFAMWLDANRNFRIDQRPWLRFETRLAPDDAGDQMLPGGDFFKKFEPGQPLTIPIRVLNGGKLPALYIEGGILVQVADKDGRSLVLPGGDFTDKAVPRVTAVQTFNVEVIPPSGHTDMAATRYGITDGHALMLTVSEIQRLSEGTDRIYIVGRLDYRDPFGTKHWTRFCKPVWDTTESLRCEQYNAMDTNF